jgi:glucokinase
MAERLVLGVDIGGTKVAAGLVNSRGEILQKFRTPMSPTGSAEAGLAAVKAGIEGVLHDDREVAAIGLISPGPLDPKSGVILNPPNLPCWRNFALTKHIADLYHVPTWLDNDANAAGLAEALWGAGKGQNIVFYATLGTGVGSGIIIDGKILHGRTGAAAECGHMSIDYKGPRCGCGKYGCIEALASGPAIANRARALVSEHTGTKLLELAGGDAAKITSEIVAAAHRVGDKTATRVLRDTAEFLAIWLGNMIDVLDPDVLVVGGGVADMMNEWFDEIKKELPKWSINPRAHEVPLLHAKYGSDAGIAGAAALCFSRE